jgi:signal transduction histidine kinase
MAMDALGTGRAVQLDKSEKLYTTAANQFYPPPAFLSLKPGFSEVVAGEHAYYVFKLQRDEDVYILVQDQQEFEARERLIYKAVLACFLISLLIAWGLGSLLANRVLQPVAQLANDVRSGARFKGSELLAKNYADDEVGRLAKVFDKTFEQLRRSLEREKLFTSDVSHELRTPLMVIGTSCELLSHSSGLSDKQIKQVDRIHRASAEMLELVETLLLLAREKGAMTQSASLVSLNEVATEQGEIWGEQFAARGIDYRCSLEEPDHGQYQAIFLRTVMSNLLRNALHYTEQGGVELQLFNGGFRVEDSGPGIAPEQQSRLFEPFQRGAHARGEGLGLGLSLVKRICEFQGWSVSVSQLQPKGCVFSVKLNAD